MDDDKRLERIEKKLDDSNEHLASIDLTLMEQHISLREHVRRTNLLEAKLIPIERHVSRVEGAIKLISILAMIAAIVGVILKR